METFWNTFFANQSGHAGHESQLLDQLGITFSLLVAGISCLVILLQDFRSRWVHILPLGLLGLSGFAFHLTLQTPGFWMQTAFNAGFILIILILAGVYLRMRGKVYLDHSLGRGDVVFFFMATPWFSGQQFLWFFVSGLLLVLLGVFCFSMVRGQNRNYPIPLAGGLAAWILCFFPLVYSTGPL